MWVQDIYASTASFCRRIGRFLLRLYQWLPVLWRDEDYDYSYLLRIMEFKLSRMAPTIKAGHGADAGLRDEEIRRAMLLLSTAYNEDPDDEWSAHHNIHSDAFTTCTGCKAALAASHKREARNWRLLWKFLEQNMRNWWD